MGSIWEATAAIAGPTADFLSQRANNVARDEFAEAQMLREQTMASYNDKLGRERDTWRAKLEEDYRVKQEARANEEYDRRIADERANARTVLGESRTYAQSQEGTNMFNPENMKEYKTGEWDKLTEAQRKSAWSKDDMMLHAAEKTVEAQSFAENKKMVMDITTEYNIIVAKYPDKAKKKSLDQYITDKLYDNLVSKGKSKVSAEIFASFMDDANKRFDTLKENEDPLYNQLLEAAAANNPKIANDLPALEMAARAAYIGSSARISASIIEGRTMSSGEKALSIFDDTPESKKKATVDRQSEARRRIADAASRDYEGTVKAIMAKQNVSRKMAVKIIENAGVSVVPTKPEKNVPMSAYSNTGEVPRSLLTDTTQTPTPRKPLISEEEKKRVIESEKYGPLSGFLK